MVEEPSPAGEAAAISPLASLWRNRDYLILWGGQAISTAGTQVSRLALPLLVLALTRSPAQAGLATSVAILPYLVLSLLAGALADRWNRKWVMILCDSGRTIAAGSIPVAAVTGHLSLVQLYAVALIEGSLNVFFDLAETAALPRVVGKEQLPVAMSQNGATYSATSLIGQPLGGLLYQIGHAIPFLADAVSYAVSVISLLFIRTELQGERDAVVPNLRLEITEGLAWLWRQPLIRFMAFLGAGAWIPLYGNYLLVIVLARHLHASPATIGLIFAANGVGGMLGSLVGGHLGRRFGFAPVVIASVWIWVLLWPLYAIAPTPLALALITGTIFLVFSIYNVVQMSYRLLLIPDALQGRVNSAFRLIAFAGMPAGTAVTGALLQGIGNTPAVLLLFVWLLVLAVITSVNPHVRHALPFSAVREI
ncbi:MAG TPA: MFS transporter [Chloroflexota bacterium]|nr:MFS transporter [Chloroflexota bacterium]